MAIVGLGAFTPSANMISAILGGAQYTGPKTPGVMITLPSGAKGWYDDAGTWHVDPTGAELRQALSAAGVSPATTEAALAGKPPQAAAAAGMLGGKLPWLLVGGVALVALVVLLKRRR